MPDGTFNLLMGGGGTVGDQIIHSDQIHAVSFTGSLPVGKQVAAATAANLVKCQLEMGSKNALIVAADADLDVAVNAAFVGAYSGTGQKCTASSRLIVDESVHDAFVEKLQAKLASVTVGHALEGCRYWPGGLRGAAQRDPVLDLAGRQRWGDLALRR